MTARSAATRHPGLREMMASDIRSAAGVFAGIVLGFVGRSWFPKRPDLDFYRTCAEVVPVLLLALGLQTRALAVSLRLHMPRLPKPRTVPAKVGRIALWTARLSARLYPVLGTVILCWTEIDALEVVARGRATRADASNVPLGLLLALGAIAMVAMFPWLLGEPKPEANSRDVSGATREQ